MRTMYTVLYYLVIHFMRNPVKQVTHEHSFRRRQVLLGETGPLQEDCLRAKTKRKRSTRE